MIDMIFHVLAVCIAVQFALIGAFTVARAFLAFLATRRITPTQCMGLAGEIIIGIILVLVAFFLKNW